MLSSLILDSQLMPFGFFVFVKLYICLVPVTLRTKYSCVSTVPAIFCIIQSEDFRHVYHVWDHNFSWCSAFVYILIF